MGAKNQIISADVLLCASEHLAGGTGGKFSRVVEYGEHGEEMPSTPGVGTMAPWEYITLH